jgi:hypothetical protein
MQCFAHPTEAAIATCRSCGRAVCRTCAKDLSFAVVCSDACATYATQLQDMTQRSLRLYGIGTTKRNLPLAPVIWGLFAILFTGFGVVGWITEGRPEWFFLGFGVLSGIVAVLALHRYKQLQLNC